MAIELALFPLSQMVLPGGRMRLRVFEPRYQRLVREAAAGKRPFASALLNPYVAASHTNRIFPLVTQVRIIDFCQLEDGLLGITIEGEQRALITERWQEQDQLHVANVDLQPDWPAVQYSPEDALLAATLQQVYQDNPELSALYPDHSTADAATLAKRWLEILTMPAPLKHQLQAEQTADLALATLRQWLDEQQQQ